MTWQRIAAALAVCIGTISATTAGDAVLDPIADAYVKLVLAVGRHDANVVDAYYGPPEWQREAAQGAPKPLPVLRSTAADLLSRVRAVAPSPRRTFLERQLVATDGVLRRLAGEKLTLAEEARVLFDIAPPVCGHDELEAARANLEQLLPGTGDLASRMAAVRARVEIPREKLAAVVDAVLAETRRRTARLVTLPPGERFEVSYVTKKPWGAYNWYKGGYQSLIEVNTDLPAALEDVLDTLAHEGYPGHHVYNALLEQHLVKERGWREYTVYPLFSPQSLIAEGTANEASRVVMTDDERHAFVTEVLAPLAGIDSAALERYAQVKAAARPLRCVAGEAARLLLDEGRPEAEVEQFLVRYGTSPARAKQNIRFARTYRSYVFNYTAGQQLISGWIGTGPDRVARFFDLLQRPVVPSELVRTNK